MAEEEKKYKSLLPFSKREMLLGVDRYWEFERGTTKLQQLLQLEIGCLDSFK